MPQRLSRAGEQALEIAALQRRTHASVSKGNAIHRAYYAQTCLLTIRTDVFLYQFDASTKYIPESEKDSVYKDLMRKFMNYVENPHSSYFDFISSLSESQKIRVMELLPTRYCR